MNFACWTSGAWAAGSWVDGSWCPGDGPEPPAPPASEGTGMRGRYYRQDLHERRLWQEDEEIIIL